jgi:hypothetical protein
MYFRCIMLTMGGGGSINFTMIHESSKWLMEQIGYDKKYWDQVKDELNMKFDCPDPNGTQTAFSRYIQDKATNLVNGPSYESPKKENLINNIPSLSAKKGEQLYAFPSQSNSFGQCTNSGVSIVNWEKVTLFCERGLTCLVMDRSSCASVKVKNSSSNQDQEYFVRLGGKGGKVILACGSQSPCLLLGTPELTKEKIQKCVNDHACMPLAIYLLPDDQESGIGPKNV